MSSNSLACRGEESERRAHDAPDTSTPHATRYRCEPMAHLRGRGHPRVPPKGQRQHAAAAAAISPAAGCRWRAAAHQTARATVRQLRRRLVVRAFESAADKDLGGGSIYLASTSRSCPWQTRHLSARSSDRANACGPYPRSANRGADSIAALGMGGRGGPDGAVGTWAREREFVSALDSVLERASESRLKALADMAVADERSAYKVVVKALDRACRKAGGDATSKLNLLFACSEVARRSRQQHGKHAKYGERQAPLISSLLEGVADTAAQARRGMHAGGWVRTWLHACMLACYQVSTDACIMHTVVYGGYTAHASTRYSIWHIRTAVQTPAWVAFDGWVRGCNAWHAFQGHACVQHFEACCILANSPCRIITSDHPSILNCEILHMHMCICLCHCRVLPQTLRFKQPDLPDHIDHEIASGSKEK
eukprot:364615-Chlamydomonas_euryale.AAC.14